jgi:hypothetical protein
LVLLLVLYVYDVVGYTYDDSNCLDEAKNGCLTQPFLFTDWNYHEGMIKLCPLEGRDSNTDLLVNVARTDN